MVTSLLFLALQYTHCLLLYTKNYQFSTFVWFQNVRGRRIIWRGLRVRAPIGEEGSGVLMTEPCVMASMIVQIKKMKIQIIAYFIKRYKERLLQIKILIFIFMKICIFRGSERPAHDSADSPTSASLHKVLRCKSSILV